MAASTSASNALPAPGDIPGADVMIYDGHCRFCTAQVRRLHRWDGKRRLTFLSLHDQRTEEVCPDLTRDQMMEQMWIIDSRGRKYAGASAFRYLTRKLPRLWPIAPPLHFPFSLPAWSWLYRQVAKRRYLMGKTDECEDDACRVHFR